MPTPSLALGPFQPMRVAAVSRHSLRAQVVTRNPWGWSSSIVGVADAELDGVEPRLARQLVHLLLVGERALRVAVAAERAAPRVVGVDAGGTKGHVLQLVQRRDADEHDVRGGGAPRGVGAVVQDRLAHASGQAALAVAPGRHADDHRLPRGRADELLLARVEDAHRLPRVPGEQRGDDLVGVGVELRAEGAADGRLQDADVLAGDAERPGEVALHEVRHLGRRHHGQPAAAVEGGQGEARLHAAVGHELRAVGALDDVGAPGNRALGVSVAELVAVGHEVVRRLLVDARRGRLHGLQRIEHRGQRLVVDPDERAGLLRRRLARRRHRRDLVAHAAHLVALEHGVVAQEPQLAHAHAVGGEHAVHAGDGLRAPHVDALDPRVGMGRAQDLPVEHAGQGHVVAVARGAGHLVPRVELGHLRPDDAVPAHDAPPFRESGVADLDLEVDDADLEL